MLINRYNTFIFDLDGTLIDSSPDIIDGVNYTLSKFNLPPKSDKEIMDNVGKGLKYLLQKTLPSDFSEENILKAYDIQKEYYEIKTIKATPYDGVIELLNTLKNNTKNIFLVTNKPQRATLEVLKSLNLTNYFNEIFGADALKEHKPSPYPVNYISSKFNLPKSEMLFIGDSITDYETSKNANINFAFVEYGYENKKVDANYKLKNISDLLEMV
jgi:phosphoglycolate phosphatase